MATFAKKYSPAKTSDVIGQDAALNQLRAFVQNFARQKKRGIILYGPPGCGKTCSAYALANELCYELLEINASDCRNADSLNSIVGIAVRQRSLLFRSKLILVDELDGVSGREDRGGVSALASLLADAYFPVIMTANDPFDKKFSSLRSKCALVEFTELTADNLFSAMKNICSKENIEHDEDALRSLARRAGGDLRGALNDLQTISAMGKVTKSEVDLLSDREREEDMCNALLKIFKTTDPKIAVHSFDYVNDDLDSCFLWLEENIPREYSAPEDVADAFDWLSKADVYRGRIRRWQHWRFQAYISEFLTAGIALSKKEKYKKIVEYQRTKRILAIWMASQKNKRKKDIAAKIAEKTHTSAKRCLKDTLPYIRIIFHKNRQLAGQLAKQLGLDNEDVEYLGR